MLRYISAMAATALLAGAASAAGAETWSFTLETSGEDVFWMSPTAVDPTAPRFDATVEITQVIADFTLSGITFTNQDVTGEIPPEFRTQAGCAVGPAPVVVVDQRVVFPEPPEPPEPAGLAADIRVELDEAGAALASATDVFLGDLEVDVPLLGLRTVTITRLELSGTVEVIPEFSPVDLDDDGVVRSGDLAVLLGAWGECTAGVVCPADLNCDGAVGSGDLAILLGAWGSAG